MKNETIEKSESSTQSKPINEIIEELREVHRKSPQGKYFHQPPWNDEIDLVCIHSNRHLDFTEIGEFKDHPSVAFLLAAHEYLPALLEYIALLESERRWIPVSEKLPDLHTPTNSKSIPFSDVVSLKLETGVQCCGRYGDSRWWDISASYPFSTVVEWRYLIP